MRNENGSYHAEAIKSLELATYSFPWSLLLIAGYILLCFAVPVPNRDLIFVL